MSNIHEFKRKPAPKNNKPRGPKPPPFFNAGNIPPLTKALLVAFITIQLILGFALPKPTVWDIYETFGFVPAFFTGAEGMPSLLSLLSPVTHMFIHSGWTHLIFNIIMLMAFGIFTERAYSARITAFFFFTSGVIGALAFLAFDPSATFPLIGASGGISGLFGIGIMLMHQDGRLGPIGGKGPWPIIGFWVAIMLFTGLIGGEGQAWQAHIAGFLGGIGLLRLYQTGRLKL